MRALLLWILWLAEHAVGDRRSRHFRIILNDMNNIHLAFGSQRLQQVVKFDSKSAHFTILDVACAVPRQVAECARYCDDVKLCRLFCSPMCEVSTTATQYVRCSEDTDYNATESTTFHDLREDVFAPSRGYRPLIGRRGRDDFAFMTHRTRKAIDDDVGFGVLRILNVTAMPFLRGLSFHTRYRILWHLEFFSFLGFKTGMVGLAPRSANGDPSLVPLLKTMGYLDRAVISLQKMSEPIFRSSFALDAYTVQFGALDKFACRWSSFSLSVDWSFPMTDLTFAGKAFPGRNIGRIAVEQSNLRIPKAMADYFVDSGLFYRIADSQSFRIDPANRTLLNLEFTVGNAKVHLGWESMMTFDEEVTYVAGGEPVRYADEIQWTIGWFPLLRGYCFGYDYDAGRVMWGERREIRLNRDGE